MELATSHHHHHQHHHHQHHYRRRRQWFGTIKHPSFPTSIIHIYQQLHPHLPTHRISLS
ncbi:GM11590 [Drosophila sechellia]|uniref:GM11590 n=1 Tax=Drosophila sechellia TaxID=7238 RepID=B4IGK7_DROSE|nr:GM11590 [Drosophila sechellia]